MKRTRFFGAFFAAALALSLTACVYDEAAPGPGPSGANNFPTATATFTPGTFRSAPIGGTEQQDFLTTTGLTGGGWRRAPLVVDVTFSENQILDITLVSHGESAYGPMYLYRAYPMVPDHILVQQSTLNTRVVDGAAVDTFVGGTFTQASIVLAVEDAIRQAGVNPDDLVPTVPTAPLAGDRFIPGSHTVYVPGGRYIFNFNTNEFSLAADHPQWPTEAVGSGWTGWDAEAAGHPPFTSSVQGGLSRVGFANPLFGRNATAVHGATLAESRGPGGYIPTQSLDAIAARMGVDVNGPNPFASAGDPLGLFITVNFGRNVFQIMEHGGGDGLGFGSNNSRVTGESMSPSRTNPDVYGTGAINTQGVNGSSSSQGLGGYWWIQVAHRTFNDTQSTQLAPDSFTSATQSALLIKRGVEMAMMEAGATQAQINNFAPRATSPFWREQAPTTPNALMLIPGRYIISLGGGFPDVAVTLCRETVRYIAIINPENGSHVSHAVGNNPENVNAMAELQIGLMGEGWSPWEWAPQVSAQDDRVGFRDRLLFAFAANYADGGRQASAFDIEGMESAPEFSAALIAALQELVTTQSYNGGNVNQAGRLGLTN